MEASLAETNWLLLPFSLATKCGGAAHMISLVAFLVALLSAWLAAAVLCWCHPGGPAWGRYRYWSSKGGCSSPAIPGPRGLPFVGSMGLMSGLAHRQLATTAERHHARRLMAFSLGETRAVVTGDPDVAREILCGATFADRPFKESAYKLMFHHSIGFAPYGVYWRTLRRVAAAHLFCPKQIAVAAPKRARIAGEMVAAFAGAGEDGRASLQVRNVLRQASLNSIMWSVFGREYYVINTAPTQLGGGVDDGRQEEARELSRMVAEGYDLLGTVSYSDHLPVLASLDLQGVRRRCANLVPRVNRFVTRIIQEHRSFGGADGAAAAAMPDFVDVLLSLQGGSDGLSDSDMVAVLWEMIFRGTDTTAVLMDWVLARLVKHGEVQEKLHRELDRVVGRARPVEEADTPSLPYLAAVIKEALRVHLPAPLMSWARLAVSDTVVGGRLVPAGTTAMVNMWAITHDPRVWPEPTQFRPERFLQVEGGAGPELYSSLFGSDTRLAPFGSGSRSCPGKALALTTVGFWVASLLQEFEWLPASEAAGAGEVDLSEVLRLTCEMASPLTVRLRRRRRQ